MRVLIVGVEALTLPRRNASNDEIDEPNTRRFYRLWQFLQFELAALQADNQLTALAFDNSQGIRIVVQRASGIAKTMVASASAIASFAPDIIYVIDEPMPDPTLDSPAFAAWLTGSRSTKGPDPTLDSSAWQAWSTRRAPMRAIINAANNRGILVRDAQNIG